MAKYEDVPLYSVIRLILEYHVDMLAVDNIYELAESSRDIAKLSKLIPTWCRIIETTASDGEYIDTGLLARKLGLSHPRDSLDTAFLNAYAALNGYGKEVKLHADRVYVIVSKGRTPGQGGTSSDRFKRSIRAAVLQVVREIREKLDANKIDYDLVVKESDGGLERGFFIVYASLEKIKEIVTPVEHKNIKVKVKPAVPLRSIHEEKRRIIVGIDPGTTVGIAVLDLNGQPLLVKSYKNPDREVVIETILSNGKPIIIAVDVSKPPEYVKKISSLLDSILFTPEDDLSVDEKQRIVNEYSSIYRIDVPDWHSRDALAAAVKAYKQVKSLIDEIESKIKGIGDIDRDDIVAQVLKGKALSEVLEDIFRKRLERESTVRSEEKKSMEPRRSEEERLRQRILELESIVRRLETELQKREDVIKNLEYELRSTRKPSLTEEFERKIYQAQIELDITRRAAKEKDNIIDLLRNRVAELERVIVDIGLGKYTLACKASSLPDCGGLPLYLDNVIYVEEVLKYVRHHRTGVLIPTGSKITTIESVRAPVIETTPILDIGNYVIVDSRILDEIRSAWSMIEKEEAKERRERILRLIKEYREARSN
ncbi:MAG: DUF460 domain-containing protein [Desulfurococcaceae archaeon]